MLYLLLYQLRQVHPGFNVLRYETFRSVLAGLAALALSLALGPLLIERFRSAHIGQTIREVVPETHQKKAGTPTMGGLLILAASLAATLLLANLSNWYVWLAIFVTISFGVIGFTDDYLKLRRGKGLGLSENAKLGAMFVLAFLVSAVLFIGLRFDTHLTVPFLKNVHPHVVGAGEIAIFCASLIASSLGFLWYNAYPASMIMGDVGALSLGGALGMVAILAKQELALVIAGGVFVIEAISVIIQRYYFKLTHRRVFRMAPLHHHYELKGWPETIVVVRFWIISIVCALVALSTLKLR